MTLVPKPAVALRAQRSVATVDRAVAAGELRPHRVGRRTLFDLSEVDRWITSRTLPVATAAEMMAALRG